MTPSKFQVEVYRAFQEEPGNQSIVAVAGSGKSTTLEHLVKLIPYEMSVLVTAFNRDIVQDLRPRMTFHPNCQVVTFNSFGNTILRSLYKIGKIDEDKTEILLRRALTGRQFDKNTVNKLYYKWRYTAKRLIDLFRANLEPDAGVPTLHYLEEYSLDAPFSAGEQRLFCEVVGDLYSNHLKERTWADFRDQVFKPIYLKMPIPQYDVVLVDEDQDLDKNQAELICSAAKRLVMVGDPRQAIYRFRGAMRDAVLTLETRVNAKRLPLSVCYRCPRKIIARAQKIVPEIEACDWAPEGIDEERTIQQFRQQVQSGHLVIARCTKPLVKECFQLIRMGKRARVRGREIGSQLSVIVDKVAEPGMSMGEFGMALKEYEAAQMERLRGREQQFIDLQDRVETIDALAENCNTIRDLQDRIDMMFTDDPNEPGILLMTIHKCKGLENTHVWILAPEQLPHPRAKSEADKEVEMNLLYVAITRTKFTMTEPGSLFWVPMEKAKTEPKAESKPKREEYSNIL